jgi:hypothetical protein
VAIANGEKPEQRIIHVGLQTRTQAEVIDGLKEGERIFVNRPAGTGERNGTQQGNNRNAQRFNRGPRL